MRYAFDLLNSWNHCSEAQLMLYQHAVVIDGGDGGAIIVVVYNMTRLLTTQPTDLYLKLFISQFCVRRHCL